MSNPSMDFDEWFKQVKEVAMDSFYYTQESVDSFDPDAWRIFYEDGETPKNAMIEELSNA